MPCGLREVRGRLEPEPASVPDRAEYDPLGENQRHLHGFPRITAEGISTKRRELPPRDRLRPQYILHALAPGVDQELAHPLRTARSRAFHHDTGYRVRRDRENHSGGAQRARAFSRKLGSSSGVTPVTTFSNSRMKPALR
jgi:hypothetical protein